MTTFFPIGVQCPECETAFAAHVLGSTNTFGPLDTDLHRHAAGFSPLPFQLAMCPSCGYTDWTSNFPRTDKPIRNLPSDETTGAGKYRALAQRLAAQPESVEMAAHAAVRGSWCARFEDQPQQEEWLQAKAVECFERAWNAGEIKNDPAVIAYLAGELCRRLGRFPEAERWWQEAERQAERPEWLEEFLGIVRPLAAAGNRRNAVVKERR